MAAQGFVQKGSAEKGGHHVPILRRFWTRGSLRNTRQAVLPPAAHHGTGEITGDRNVLGAPEDLAWLGEQCLIERKHRDLGHM